MKYLVCSKMETKEKERSRKREAANRALTTLDYKNSKLQKEERNDARLYMQRAHRSKTNDKNE